LPDADKKKVEFQEIRKKYYFKSKGHVVK
jgi:hypothetical protein